MIFTCMQEMYMDIFADHVKQAVADYLIPNLYMDATRIVLDPCYNAIESIGKILRDEKLTDENCFLKIEAIIQEFERLGIGCGIRHDG